MSDPTQKPGPMDGDEWHHTIWSDGSEIIYSTNDGYACMAVERVVKPESRRKHWCVVARQTDAEGDYSLYPPKIAGPFPTLEGALTAYKILLAGGAS